MNTKELLDAQQRLAISIQGDGPDRDAHINRAVTAHAEALTRFEQDLVDEVQADFERAAEIISKAMMKALVVRQTLGGIPALGALDEVCLPNVSYPARRSRGPQLVSRFGGWCKGSCTTFSSAWSDDKELTALVGQITASKTLSHQAVDALDQIKRAAPRTDAA